MIDQLVSRFLNSTAFSVTDPLAYLPPREPHFTNAGRHPRGLPPPLWAAGKALKHFMSHNLGRRVGPFPA